MIFEYSDKLKQYMQRTHKEYILIEVVTADTSDLEVSEIAVRFVDRKMAEHYITKKRFRQIEGETGKLLLPPYPIKYSDTVQLSLRSFLFFHLITQKGMKL